MTNQMIILQEQVRLAAEGVLKYTGRVLELPDGSQIKEIQPIHTYAHWRALGYAVKRGEKAITSFPVWKYTRKRKEGMTEEEAQAGGYCFMKKSAFFTDAQVERISID